MNLLDLMIDYGVGVDMRRERKTFTLDSEYFEE